mmetsp:Transcript_153279/g.267237  ORF Transcript_153279/g.267237 Transcript_153279/m.267237 type:complete len:85 (-) Transcript_153279:82-336(-)
MKIIKSLGLDGNKVLLPTVIYAIYMWAVKEKTEAAVKSLPFPITMAFTMSWIHDFRANNLEVIIALQGKDTFQPRTPGCGIFSA